MNKYSATEQPNPTSNSKPAVWELVMRDMTDRDVWGRSKYKTPLQPFNGRNVLVDLYQELLDAVVYTRQFLEETEVDDVLRKIDTSKLTQSEVMLLNDLISKCVTANQTELL